MLRKIISRYSENIITPALTSLLLLGMAAMEAPKGLNYLSSFIAEGVVFFIIYRLSISAIKESKQEEEERERAVLHTFEQEISSTTALLITIGAENKEQIEKLSKHLNEVIDRKNDFTQKKIKKQLDELDLAQKKHNALIKEKQGAEEKIEKTIENAAKAYQNQDAN